MIKFYYSTVTSSLMSRLAFEEAGVEHKPMEVSWSKNLNVAELNDINPLGLVPTIVTADGKTVTQNVAIVEFVADQKPEKKLLGKAGTSERAQAMSWVSFAAAEFQRSFYIRNRAEDITEDKKAQKEIQTFAEGKINEYLSYIDESLNGQNYLVGNQFSVADIAVFTFLGWANWYEIPLTEFKNLKPFLKRISERPAVHKILKDEGLVEDYI